MMTALAEQLPAVDASWMPVELNAEIDEAFAAIDAGLDRLLEIGDRGDFMALGPDRLLELLRSFEARRNRLPAVDHLLVTAVGEERLWEHSAGRGEAGVLCDVLRLSPGAARARVRDAKRLGERFVGGQVLPPLLPVVAAAQRTGALNAEQTRVITTAMDHVDKIVGVHPEHVQKAEEVLVEHAAAMRPAELRGIGLRIVDVLNPDGTLPLDALTQARRGLNIGDARPDGTCPISGSLTPAVRAKFVTVLNALAAPTPTTADGPDTRTPEQRNHDALEDACDLMLRSGGLPASGGIPTTLIVTVSAETLQAAATALGSDTPAQISRQHAATTADGQILSLDELLRLADDAHVIPAYLNNTGGIMAFGRRRRLPSLTQTIALIARDVGCSFPGCTAPPQMCERHHIVPWLLGGRTDIDNLTLLCAHHHREFERRGWRCRMRDGLPEWIPPRWIDPAQRPLRNLRILHTHLTGPT